MKRRALDALTDDERIAMAAVRELFKASPMGIRWARVFLVALGEMHEEEHARKREERAAWEGAYPAPEEQPYAEVKQGADQEIHDGIQRSQPA